MDLGLLIVRVVFGLLLVVHGSQKLFGWFGGGGVRGTSQFFESLGFAPAWVFVVATGLAESGGGLLLTLGLMQPLAAAPVISVMVVAIVTVHWGRGLLAPEGLELPLLYLTAGVSLALTGSGAYSLDTAFDLTPLWTAEVRVIAIAVAVVGALASLGLRRLPSPVAHA